MCNLDLDATFEWELAWLIIERIARAGRNKFRGPRVAPGGNARRFMNLRSIRGLRPARPRVKIREFQACMESLEPRQLLTLSPPAVGGSALVNPADFRVTVFAQGLNFPTGVVAEPDGSLLVALNKPPTGGTNFYDTTGQVIRLVDTNGDGVADGSPTLLADGLPALCPPSSGPARS